MGADPSKVVQVTGAVGWRKDSIKYRKNEVFPGIMEQAQWLQHHDDNEAQEKGLRRCSKCNFAAPCR